MTDKKEIIFIVNPRSGTHDKSDIPRVIEQTIDKAKFDYRVQFTEYAGHAAEIARRCVASDVNIVVAVGGDGTVNEVARSLVHTETALGIVPCGSGNGLARHLCIPMDIRKAIAIINRCNIEALDYGVINSLPFFCTCGMGFDAFISMKFAEAGRRGPMTYIENILREGLKYKPETYEITSGDTSAQSEPVKAFLISCANASQYGNNAYIAPQASMSDGLLDVTIMKPFDMLEAPQISIDIFNKTLDKNPKIKTFKTGHIHVHRQKAGFIHYDGDPLMTGADVDISVVSKGVKMIVNPCAPKDKRQPSVMQTAFSVFFNDIMNAHADKLKQAHRIQAINKMLLRKLNNL